MDFFYEGNFIMEMTLLKRQQKLNVMEASKGKLTVILEST